jgi:hypothetical protein
VFPSDLPGVNPATLNEMFLYYRLMTKRSGLGDSTELSRVGLSQRQQKFLPRPPTYVPAWFRRDHLGWDEFGYDDILAAMDAP